MRHAKHPLNVSAMREIEVSEAELDESSESELDQDFDHPETELSFDDAASMTNATNAPVHEDDADPITDPKLVSTKPGRVVTRGQFVVHTQLAHRLFYGRKKGTKTFIVDGKKVTKKLQPVVGVVRFGTYINDIYNMASLDDPYADATLIDIEDGFVKLRERLATNIEALRQLLGDTEGMTIHQSFSVKPLTLPLEFKTPYFGFEASRVVKYFDRLVLFALATKQTGDILQSDWNRLVNKTGTNIRHVFFMAAQYRVTGVTRDDFAANNAKARAAIEKYGELPQDILEGRKRARHAPKIRKVG